MENVEHESVNHERDNVIIKRLVIIIFIVFTLAAIAMTYFYGLPWSK